MKKKKDIECQHDNNNIQIPVGDSCNLLNLTYFLPIEISKVIELDNKLCRMNNSARNYLQSFVSIYRSIEDDYSSFKLRPTSWRYALLIPFYREDEWFSKLEIHIYRGSQNYLVMMLTLHTSETLKYYIWNELRKNYDYLEEKHIEYTECFDDYQMQQKGFTTLFKNIELRGSSVIMSYFSDICFQPIEYHIPCVRSFIYNKYNIYNTNNYNYFWESIGLEDSTLLTYAEDSNIYKLCQNMKGNYINIFINKENLILDELFHDIYSQIYYILSHSIFKSIGPGLALSEVFNWIFKKYQYLQKEEGIFKLIRKHEAMSKIIYYISLFDIEILDDDFFYRGSIQFNKKIHGKRIIDDDYYDLIKNVIEQKKNVLEKLYAMETTYLSSSLIVQISKSNLVIQIGVGIMMIISIVLGVLSLL